MIGKKIFTYAAYSDGKDYENLKAFLKECYQKRNRRANMFIRTMDGELINSDSIIQIEGTFGLWLKVKISDGTKHYINENNASKFISEKELKQFESDIEWLRLYWATGGKVDKEN